MLKRLACLLFLVIASFSISVAQHLRAFNNNVAPVLNEQGNTHGLFKASLLLGTKQKGCVALSYGLWDENPTLQYSLNTCIQWRFGSRFLGNFRDAAHLEDTRSKSQVVFMFSPMLTINLAKRDYAYQELEPFYLGTANAVFSKYKYSFTLGSSFTMSPRGTYKNVSTLRNRSQQVAMFALNLKDFNFTVYDDYVPYLTTWLQLGDNWDRFFTGGGFVRYRFSDEFTLHVYSEVYTGINRANAFLKPDIISYKKNGKDWNLKNFANQDPSQEYFNSSWFIVKGTYTGRQSIGKSGFYIPSFDALIGSSAPWTMFSQTVIHKLIKYDTTNNFRLHYFLHRLNVPGNLEAGGKTGFNYFVNTLFTGAGAQSNISLP